MARQSIAGHFVDLLCWMLVGLFWLAIVTFLADWFVKVPATEDVAAQLKWNGPHWFWVVLIYLGLTLGFWLFARWVNKMEAGDKGGSTDGSDGGFTYLGFYSNGGHYDGGDGGGGDGGGGDGGGGGE